MTGARGPGGSRRESEHDDLAAVAALPAASRWNAEARSRSTAGVLWQDRRGDALPSRHRFLQPTSSPAGKLSSHRKRSYRCCSHESDCSDYSEYRGGCADAAVMWRAVFTRAGLTQGIRMTSSRSRLPRRTITMSLARPSTTPSAYASPLSAVQSPPESYVIKSSLLHKLPCCRFVHNF